MNKPVEIDIARVEPVVLVPKPSAPNPATPHRRRVLPIAAVLSLAVLAAVGVVWWFATTEAPVRYTTAPGHARRGDPRGDRDRHGQSGAHDHRRELRLRRHPGDLHCDLQYRRSRRARFAPRSIRARIRPWSTRTRPISRRRKAQLEKDKANLAYTQLNYERNVRLAQTNAVSKDARRHRQERPRSGARADRRRRGDASSSARRNSTRRRSISATPISFRRWTAPWCRATSPWARPWRRASRRRRCS